MGYNCLDLDNAFDTLSRKTVSCAVQFLADHCVNVNKCILQIAFVNNKVTLDMMSVY